MTRENILFTLVGLLLGYVVAFHLVVYVKQNQPLPRGADGVSADVEMTAEQGALPASDVQDGQRLSSAAELAAKAAREDPKNFDAQFKAGEASLEAGDGEGAIDFFTRANLLRPSDYDTLVRLGNANFEADRLEVAERWYKEALEKKPDDVGVRADLGLTYFKRKPPQADKAVAELRRALEYDPGNVLVLHNLTLMLLQSRDYDGAEATLAKLEKLDPQGSNTPRLREELEKSRRENPASTGDKAQKKSPTD
ncbi:MAG TPA: tetratricopeptide repeat protein [Pyrinomonadaceae bacterium]|nr:tetratricopeptide repeat protein [Pyrinomonadaceae bacterium]